MTEQQKRYKQNTEKRMRPNIVTFTPGHCIFERQQHTNEAGGKHELQVLADGPLQIIAADATAFTMGIGNQVNKIARDRVVDASMTTEDVPLITSDLRHRFNLTHTHLTAESACRLIRTQKHIIDRIISHATHTNNRTLYEVQWYTCGSEHDTLELIQHLPHSHLIR